MVGLLLLLLAENVKIAIELLQRKRLHMNCQRPGGRARSARRVHVERGMASAVVRERASEMKKVIVSERWTGKGARLTFLCGSK